MTEKIRGIFVAYFDRFHKEAVCTEGGGEGGNFNHGNCDEGRHIGFASSFSTNIRVSYLDKIFKKTETPKNLSRGVL
jgi:hypothetical protein